uniref:Uncharacterized protein n=1 Tax=Arundo donax TaxID=35708 RepID=A0A0A9ELX1_ARUDO
MGPGGRRRPPRHPCGSCLTRRRRTTCSGSGWPPL